MEIKYKILQINYQDHAVAVRYYTDIATEELLCNQRNEDGSIGRCMTDYYLNVWQHDLSPEDIHKYIQASAPVAWLQLKERIINNEPSTLTKIKYHVNVEHSFEPQTAMTTPENLTEEEVEALIKSL